MFADIITIGDEILIGQIVDSNSAYLGQSLNKLGVEVRQISSISDKREAIIEALHVSGENAQLVIVTGGLGPTKDDVTKSAICEFFEDELVLNQDVLAHIEYLFENYISSTISDMNREQAWVPSKAQVLHNAHGTAPGLWLKKNNAYYAFFPGVPFEMKHLFEDKLTPIILETFDRPSIIHRTLLTFGLGESSIAQRIEDIEDGLPEELSLAYLPSFGRVRLRLTARGWDQADLTHQLEVVIAKLLPRIEDIFVGFEEDGALEEQVGKLLTERGLTLVTSESCTGGQIAGTISAVPGASKYYLGSVVAYATDVKKNVLGIDDALIEEHSVVSEEVAREMAVNARKLMNADYAISSTGNAGPSKGESDSDVGTVFIALASKDGVQVNKFSMGTSRSRVIGRSVSRALTMLHEELISNRKSEINS